MKKSLFVVSSLILILAITFTACGKKSVFTDEYGETHIAVTEKGGAVKQDTMGNLYEVVTDANGEERTQIFDFPPALTNRANTWIENGVLHMDIPKGWKASGLSDKMVLYHSGECTDTDTPHCELNFRYSVMRTLDEIYSTYLGQVKYLTQYSGECSELKEYETELFGQKIKAISYKFDKTNIYCYCYFIQKEAPVIEIEAYAYDKCYTEEELIALLEKNCTLKDLGGTPPSTELSTTTTED